ncbi:iron ABC transporter permease [Rubrivivax sp. JA1026]|uniref:ABC transporter permease n=1 Tax=Rubrivivax sp. JA1026 TaxID=2710888 RepID=UPI00197DA72E|nr:iron ABC transporter permease [Rubrivivax sp. JA1026]
MATAERGLNPPAFAPAAHRTRHLPWRGALAALPIALLTLLPLGAVLVLALAPQADTWAHLWQHVLPRVLANTALLMALVAVGVLAVGVPLAWLTAMCEFPGRRVFAWALVLPLAFPAYVLAFVQMGLFEYAGPVQTALRELFGSSRWFPEIRGSFWGLTLVLVLAFYPYVYLLARGAFLTQGRRALEAAQTLGCSPAGALWRVALPMARPWIGAGLALVLMETLADFGAVAVFNVDTFTTALYKAWFDLHDLGAAAQLASLLVLVVLVLVAAEQRSRQAQRFDAAAGGDARRALGPRARWLATAFCAAVLGAAFVVPMLQIVAWSLQVWREDLDARYWGFAWNTLRLAGATALAVTVLALLLSWIRRRHADAATAWLVRLAVVGYAFPGVVLAVGVFVPIAWLDEQLLALLKPFGVEPLALLKGSLATMLLALAARFMAVGFHATDSAMQRVSRHQEEACASLGQTPWQTLRRLHLPLLRGGLLAAFLMVLVDVMKEMPITLMTRSFGWDTLAVRVFQLTSESMWQQAALPALAIVLVGLLPVALLVMQTERRPSSRTPS